MIVFEGFWSQNLHFRKTVSWELTLKTFSWLELAINFLQQMVKDQWHFVQMNPILCKSLANILKSMFFKNSIVSKKSSKNLQSLRMWKKFWQIFLRFCFLKMNCSWKTLTLIEIMFGWNLMKVALLCVLVVMFCCAIILLTHITHDMWSKPNRWLSYLIQFLKRNVIKIDSFQITG